MCPKITDIAGPNGILFIRPESPVQDIIGRGLNPLFGDWFFVFSASTCDDAVFAHQTSDTMTATLCVMLISLGIVPAVAARLLGDR